MYVHCNIYTVLIFCIFFQKAQQQANINEKEKPTSLTEKEKDEEERLLQELEEEMNDLSVPSDKIEEIKEEMQKEFDNIINEVCTCETNAGHRFHWGDHISHRPGNKTWCLCKLETTDFTHRAWTVETEIIDRFMYVGRLVGGEN